MQKSYMKITIKYKNDLIVTLARSEMKNLWTISADDIHFDFKGDIYVQWDPVVISSLLTPVLAGLFMVGLDRTIISISSDILSFWRYLSANPLKIT